jgi:hypothetical protein
MLTRRALALTTLFCLLIGLLAVPRGPMLVCRITGMPMAPVLVSAEDDLDSCCDVEVSLRTADSIQYELAAPGCCELRQDAGHVPAPAIPAAGPDTFAVALVPVPPTLPVPVMTPVTVEREVKGESAPRAPPVISSSPRAPPFFS